MSYERIWCMPDSQTFQMKPVKNLIKSLVLSGVWLDPFANKCVFLRELNTNAKIITNDLNPEYPTDYHLECCDFLEKFEKNSIDGILYDPPYSYRQLSECYKGIGLAVTGKDTSAATQKRHKDAMDRILKEEGYVISFGWNSNGMGINRGYTITQGLLLAHGGDHNDTIVTVERKNKTNFLF